MRKLLFIAAFFAMLSLSSGVFAYSSNYYSYFDNAYGAGAGDFVPNVVISTANITYDPLGCMNNYTYLASHNMTGGMREGVMRFVNFGCAPSQTNNFTFTTFGIPNPDDGKVKYFRISWGVGNSYNGTIQFQVRENGVVKYMKNYTDGSYPINAWIDSVATYKPTVGSSISLALAFFGGNASALDFYVDQVDIATLETDEAWVSIPSDSYMRGLCNATTTYKNLGITSSGNVSVPLEMRLYSIANDTDAMCAIFYKSGVLTVRLPKAPENATINVSTKWLQSVSNYDLLAFFNDFALFYVKGDYYVPSSPCDETRVEYGSLINYVSRNSVVASTFMNYLWECGSGHSVFSPLGNLNFSTSGSVPMTDILDATENQSQASFDISGYNVTGSQFYINGWGVSWGGSSYPFSGYSSQIYSNALNVPFSTYPVCAPEWFCNANSERYVTSECLTTAVRSCGGCGCASEGAGGRCAPNVTGFVCHTSQEIWHYTACVRDNNMTALCDIRCEDDQCVGESTCDSDSDCSNFCDGSNRHYGMYCDLSTFSCKSNFVQNCTFGCVSGSCLASAPLPPLSLNASSPVQVISDMSRGILGFLNFTANPFMSMLFIFIAAMIIIAFFSLAAHILKNTR